MYMYMLTEHWEYVIEMEATYLVPHESFYIQSMLVFMIQYVYCRWLKIHHNEFDLPTW